MRSTIPLPDEPLYRIAFFAFSDVGRISEAAHTRRRIPMSLTIPDDIAPPASDEDRRRNRERHEALDRIGAAMEEAGVYDKVLLAEERRLRIR